MNPPFKFDHGLGHVGSTWKPPIGKLLTNRRIRELMQEGHYGPLMKLPPRSSGYCIEPGCGRHEFTRRASYNYLPKWGVYCPVCLDKYKEKARLERELRKKIREAREAEFNPENWKDVK